ncbi:MAG: PD40 domain-containing protein, partial [Alistipes sp.]|nr:PD40 domain-containing protein [Alistipes sp.]
MKKFLLMMAIAAMGVSSCEKRPAPLTIDNALTAAEMAEGRLTPEVMWKMSRASQSSLSPDGAWLLYAQTDYNMAENRGSTTLWVEELATKEVRQLTDRTSQNTAPQWSADGKHIYFLSDRSGSMQLWQMNADG